MSGTSSSGIATKWERTMELRWLNDVLQQKWNEFEMRLVEMGGWDNKYDWVLISFEWRDVPTVKSPDEENDG